MTISKSFYKELREHLYSDYLNVDDFKIDLKDGPGNIFVKVTISYLFNDQYKLTFNTGEKMSINFIPGSMTLKEDKVANGKEELLAVIDYWLNNIEEEINAAPGFRFLKKNNDVIMKKIEEVEDSFKDIDSGPFSEDEILEFKEKLEKFRTEFTTKLEEELQDKMNLRSEIKQVNQDIDFLKSQIESLTKENWAKSLFIRTLNWRKRNPKVMGMLAKATREMLPEGVKEHIPDTVVDLIAGAEEH